MITIYADINQECISCHQQEHSQWKNSHHDLAMQVANKHSVLGSFNDTKFINLNGVTTRFYKDGLNFMVYTDGSDGKMHAYKISYTFGIYPLQQYMIAFEDGRVQVLDIAWDTREKSMGGQRWYALHPNETIDYKDILHWSGPNLNWNYMCADCHSTNLKKNYNAKNDTYNTQYSAINVSCIACHTMQDNHQLSPQRIEKREWVFEKGKTSAHLKTLDRSKEVPLCAQCHSRRIQLDDNLKAGDNFFNHYEPLFLDEDLYFSDGQIKDEVYVYNSFLQSKMYQEGVICSDCHNPHSLKRKAEADNICLKCHQFSSFSSTSHHKHQKDSKGASCISCHMPSRTYMGIDERNDHSFRVPRPDLSINTEIPNACTNCHKDKTALWASNAMKKWYKKTPKGHQDFSDNLSALRSNTKNAQQSLYDVLMHQAPDIAKASVVSYLGNYPSQQTYTTTLQMLKSKKITIRLNALKALENFPLKYRSEPGLKVLSDEIKAVRIEAARILAPLLHEEINKTQKQVLQKAIQEYEETLLFNGERPESQSALALLYLDMQDYKKAERAFKKAIEIQKKFIPAYINYADYLKSINQEGKVFSVLNDGLSEDPESAVLHQALGLYYIRNKQMKKGIKELEKASVLSPTDLNIQYTYAISLAQTDMKKSISILEKQLKVHSGDMRLLQALVFYYQELGDYQKVSSFQKTIQEINRPNYIN